MYRFDLDHAVAAWRRSLETNRAFLADDLDELEGHLRDHVDALRAEGLSDEQAFRKALERLGAYGELEEEYRKVSLGRSKRRRTLHRNVLFDLAMLKNYVTTALRNLRRHKGYAAINLGGLAVGLAACLLIGLFVQDELAYDRFHEKGDRIYRMGRGTIGWPYGRIVEAEYPEVEAVTYLRAWPTFSILHEGEHLFEPMLYADDDFFRVFDFPLVEGDPATALEAPFTLVLSERLATKLYGGAAAVGRTLTLADTLTFTVSGVARVPRRSHIQFDALLSFETLRARDPEWYDTEMQAGWLDLNVVNYVLLREGADARALEAKIAGLPMERAAEYLERFGATGFRLALEPMQRIYLRSDYGNSLGPQSDIAYVYLLSAVGLFLLVIAAVNFVNLATARSVERAREIGVRKVVGSTRGAIVRQFLTESLLTCVLAVVVAVGLAVLCLPLFNDLALKSYASSDLLSLETALVLAGLVVVVAFLAGAYPALSISSFRPAEVLKGRFATGRRGAALRKGLVVFQFALSGILIIGTLVVMSQLRYLQGQDLGFDGEQVLVLDARRAPGTERARREEAFTQTLASHPGVERLSLTWAVPGRTAWQGQLSFPEGWPDDRSMSLEYVAVDHAFVETLGLEVVAGRDFDPALETDARNAVLINEAAVEAVGWASPQEAVGKRFASPGSGKPEGVVVGVLADYHHHGLQERIGPMMFGIRQGNGLVALRIEAASAAAVVAHVERTWGQFFEGYPFEYFFLDDDFAEQYAQERRLTRIFGTFAVLTILIACLGLFGLAAYTATQRTKEVGVRKVLGASGPQIALLLAKDLLKLVLVALVVASPVAYFAMRRWLEDFAYRMEIGPGVFVLAAVLALLVAVLTVSFQAVRAAMADPVDSLRYE